MLYISIFYIWHKGHQNICSSRWNKLNKVIHLLLYYFSFLLEMYLIYTESEKQIDMMWVMRQRILVIVSISGCLLVQI